MAVMALSFDEIAFVSGGNAPTCQDGYEVQSYTHDGNGNITSVTCVPTSTTEIAQVGADLLSKGAEIVDTVIGWFGG